MKAVNLIPSDARRGGRGAGGRSGGAVYVLLGALAVAVALVAVYVTATNQISTAKAKISALQTEALAASGTAARLAPYVQFAQLAQARATTIRGIAANRFDWHAALANLARVVPANTSLQSLSGSVVPGAAVSGASSGGSSSLRGDINAPAFEITGCSGSQDDVARLISRLRLIDGVTRVSLQDSQKSASGAGGPSVATTGSAGSSGSSGQGCGANRPTWDIVVFFSALPGAGADGVTSLTSSIPGATTATSATATTTTAATTTTTPTTTTGAKP